jgi:hypothetical protein
MGVSAVGWTAGRNEADGKIKGAEESLFEGEGAVAANPHAAAKPPVKPATIHFRSAINRINITILPAWNPRTSIEQIHGALLTRRRPPWASII